MCISTRHSLFCIHTYVSNHTTSVLDVILTSTLRSTSCYSLVLVILLYSFGIYYITFVSNHLKWIENYFFHLLRDPYQAPFGLHQYSITIVRDKTMPGLRICCPPTAALDQVNLQENICARIRCGRIFFFQ